MKRRVLIGSRIRGHQRSPGRQLTQRCDTTKSATTRTSCFWKYCELILFSILWLIFTSCWFGLIYPISLVNSIVDVKMFSTRKKQQNKKFFSKSNERDTDFVIGQSNQNEQTESSDSVICRGNSSDNKSNLTQVNYPQVDVHTLEGKIVSKVRSEVDNVMTSVEIRVQYALLTARENLVIPRLELALKSTNAYSDEKTMVLYWNLIRGIFRVISKAYKWPP